MADLSPDKGCALTAEELEFADALIAAGWHPHEAEAHAAEVLDDAAEEAGYDGP